MQFTLFTSLALFALSAAAPVQSSSSSFTNYAATAFDSQHNAQLQAAHDSVVNAQQVQDTLNHQLQSNNAHSNADRINAYITGSDSQTDIGIAAAGKALAPLTGGLSQQVANAILGPFVQSVTNGAEVFLANMIGGVEDRAQAERIYRMTGDYSRLASLAVKNNVPADKLINLNKQIVAMLPSDMHKRAAGDHPHNAFLDGAHDSMVNAQQVQDTLNHQMQSNGAHSNAERLNAYITGADSQTDIAIATVSKALAPFTGGLSMAIGNALLGPFVQSVTNGAEVFLANMVGGAEDRLNAEAVYRMTGNYDRLAALAVKNNVPADKLINLNKQIVARLPKN